MKIAGKLVVVSSSLLLAACVSHRPPVVYTTPGGQVISAGPDARTAADHALETSLRAELNRYGDLGHANPDVQVYASNGTVTLRGPVRNDRDRQMIDTLVRNTPGVANVNDQLQPMYPPTGPVTPPPYSSSAPVYPPPVVSTPGWTPRVEAGTAGDEPLVERIREELRVEAVPPDALQNVTIQANHGAAYVRGSVATQQERQAIDTALQHVPGVTAVYDQLQLQ